MIHTFSSTIRRKEMDAVLTCMVEEKIGPGDISRKLIGQAGEFFGVDGAAALRSPALALYYALKTLALAPQAKVVVSALAPAWHYAALLSLGYTPVVLDVQSDTAQLDAESVADAVKDGARAIVLYEPLGYLPDMEKMMSLDIPVIEDISQSAGSSLGETRAGSFGVFAVLGLEERDALTAGGGALLLAAKRRDALALKKNIEGDSLSLGKLEIDILPDINSALALIQLKEFAKNEARRKEIHEAYAAALRQGRHKMLPVQSGVERAAYCFAAVLDSGFKDVKQYAAKKGIEIEQAFARSIAGVFPEACESCVRARSLFLRTALFPLYPRLTKTQAETVCKALATLP